MQVLTADDSYTAQELGVLTMGRQRMLVRLVDSTAIVGTWAAVLAAGNTSGAGHDPTISSGASLVFDGTPQPALTGNMRVPAAWSLVARRSSDSGDFGVLDFGVTNADRVTLGNSTLTTQLVAGGASSGLLGVIGAVQRWVLTGAAAEYNVPVVQFNGAQPNVEWGQGAVAGAATTMTVRSQGSTGSTGGDLNLRGGASGANQQAGHAIVRGGSPSSGPFVGFAILRHSDGNDAVVVQDGVAHTGGQAIRIDAGGLAFFDGASATRPSVTGATGGNAALQSLLSALDSMGLITDNTT